MNINWNLLQVDSSEFSELFVTLEKILMKLDNLKLIFDKLLMTKLVYSCR